LLFFSKIGKVRAKSRAESGERRVKCESGVWSVSVSVEENGRVGSFYEERSYFSCCEWIALKNIKNEEFTPCSIEHFVHFLSVSGKENE
jgi:hypothetical protein